MYMQSMGTATMAVRVATVETATPKKANFFTDSTS
jgi:hypothetical protein